MKAFYNVIKIIIDEIIALVALIILAIPFLVVAIIIKCTSKGPVFFKQKRVGKNNKLFYIHKFRTMRIDAPHDIWCDGRCVQDPGTYSPRHSDSRLLAIPASCSRVADYNPN